MAVAKTTQPSFKGRIDGSNVALLVIPGEHRERRSRCEGREPRTPNSRAPDKPGSPSLALRSRASLAGDDKKSLRIWACRRCQRNGRVISLKLIQYPAQNFSSMRAEIASRTASLCWITSPERIFFKISFVKSEPALEPTRSNHQLGYIPTIVSRTEQWRSTGGIIVPDRARRGGLKYCASAISNSCVSQASRYSCHGSGCFW